MKKRNTRKAVAGVLFAVVAFVIVYFWGQNYVLIVGQRCLAAQTTMFRLPDFIILGEHDAMLFRTAEGGIGYLRIDCLTMRAGFKYTSGYSSSLDKHGAWLITRGEVYKRQWLTRIGPNIFTSMDLGSHMIVNVGPEKFDWIHGTVLSISSTNVIAVASVPSSELETALKSKQIAWRPIAHEL